MAAFSSSLSDSNSLIFSNSLKFGWVLHSWAVSFRVSTRISIFVVTIFWYITHTGKYFTSCWSSSFSKPFLLLAWSFDSLIHTHLSSPYGVFASIYCSTSCCENIALIGKNSLLRAISCWIYCPKYLRLPISNTCVVVFIFVITWLFAPCHLRRSGVSSIYLSWLPLDQFSDLKSVIFYLLPADVAKCFC